MIKMIKTTKEQDKIIDLIKSGTPKNLRLAFDFNNSQKLKVDSIYLALYKKWDRLISDEFRDLLNCFPIISSFKNTLTNQNCFVEKSFDKKIDGICDLILDLDRFFYYKNQIVIITTKKIDINDYKTKFLLQKKISKKTGIETSRISIGEDLPF